MAHDFFFTKHAKFQSESERREVLGMTYHNIISTVDSEALRKHASELLYVVSCNKWSSNVILLGLL